MFNQSGTEESRQSRRISCLREAIRANRLHFPEPVPTFPREFRSDVQWRMAELYFIRGWSAQQLAERYGVSASRIQQSLRAWVRRAIESGYLREIPKCLPNRLPS